MAKAFTQLAPLLSIGLIIIIAATVVYIWGQRNRNDYDDDAN